jgi:hypothetical protein
VRWERNASGVLNDATRGQRASVIGRATGLANLAG